MQKLHNKSYDPAIEARLNNILDKLYGFYSQKIDMSLERVERFLHQLDDPHLNLPPVVHVAGTNGKGSTIAILRSLLEADGKSVHVMTSPHLVHPTERIRLAGELISSKYLIELLEECMTVNKTEPITFFEMFTAATYLAFSRNDADICLLETGMGGRLDASNVVPNPICTIITMISIDHENFLGNTLEKIAFEKAGIIKVGVPCIIGYQTKKAQKAKVLDVFRQTAKKISPEPQLLIHGQEWNITPIKDQMHFISKDIDITINTPNLLGDHQIYNAGAALSAYKIIKNYFGENENISANKISAAMKKIHWPGRLQKMEDSFSYPSLPNNWELWLDGGHNDSAGEFLAKQARKWQEEDHKPLHLIIAMVDRKDPAAFLTPLLPYTSSITLIEITGEETSFNINKLQKIVENIGFSNIQLAKNLNGALKNIVNENQENGRILATGSLYFLGNILSGLSN